ncbi:MAG: carboxypeptidase regulatory-like domain-containing protein [Desulfamplus sp.]|nr:carboxypeptidase regulatory-like domain-containing protein [Desulfamplus sp.]
MNTIDSIIAVKQRLFSVMIAMLTPFIVGLCYVGASEITIPLSGTISDISTGRPIAAAAISTNMGSTVQSDPQGYYQFDTLLSGVYDITVSKTGYQSVTFSNVVIYPSQSNYLNVLLTTPGLLNIETTTLSPAEV